MRASEIAKRYAKALFELAIDKRNLDQVFEELRTLDIAFQNDKSISEFLVNPLVKGADRLNAINQAMNGKNFSTEVIGFVTILTRRNRLVLFHDIVLAFEAETDAANGVCRGTVRSAVALGAPDRQRIEATVEQNLKKKVIMNYQIDPTVIGGLIAQVGSYTFDDSISSHLRRMNEELKRRTV